MRSGLTRLSYEARVPQAPVRALGRFGLALPKLREKPRRILPLALVDSGVEQAKRDRRVAGGIGCRGGALDAREQLTRRYEIGDVFEQRAEAAAARANVVQSLLRRLANESSARSLERVALATDGFLQPAHDAGAFDGSISGALREVSLPT
jgi:hypothetical protein